MNNLYHKVAVASVCTALSFALVANKEAKAAIFSLEATTTFEVYDSNNANGPGRDGLGDRVNHTVYGLVRREPESELASFTEFNIGNFSSVPNTFINSAIFQTQISRYNGGRSLYSDSLSIFGYVGNGTAEASDFEAGVFLGSLDTSSSSFGDILNFDVTQFVNQRVSNGDAFAGFSLRVMERGGLVLGSNFYPGIPPRLIVETANVPEPVPEPTTIFGSAIGLCLGRWLKRKKLTLKNKITSQG